MNITFPSIQLLRLQFNRLRGVFLLACMVVAAAATKAEAGYTFTLIADSTGPFRDFGAVPSPSLNAVGTVAFNASLDNGRFGVFTGNGAVNTTVAQSTSSNFPLVYGSFGTPTINMAGNVAFYNRPESGFGAGIFVGNGGSLITIADTAGQFSGFSSNYSTAINFAGRVAFGASLDAGPAGIFASNGGVVTPILINSVSLGYDGTFTPTNVANALKCPAKPIT